MELKKIEHKLSVCKVTDISDIDLTMDFYFIGKTDEEVMQIMQYTLANIRVRKSRIKSDTGVETFEALISK